MTSNRDRSVRRHDRFPDSVVILNSRGTSTRDSVFTSPTLTEHEVELIVEPLISEETIKEQDLMPSSSTANIPPPIRPRLHVPRSPTDLTDIYLSDFITKEEGISSTLKSVNFTKHTKASGDKVFENPSDPESISEYLMPEIKHQNDSNKKCESKKPHRDRSIKATENHCPKNESHQSGFNLVNTTQNNAEIKSRKKNSKCSRNRRIRNILHLGKTTNVVSLSPRMQSLHNFFEENRKKANAWKVKILSENKKRSQRDLQWAERQLKTFSTNNLRSASPVKGHFIRILSDVTSGDYYDTPNQSVIPKVTEGFDLTYHFPAGDKVTPEAQEILLVLRDTVALIINDIITIEQELSKKNFNPCFSVVEHLEMLPNMLIALIDHLQYTPSEFELVSVAKNVNSLIEDVTKDPVIILFRMIELGHYLYCLGRILGEKIMPRDLPRLLHSIQVKLQRIKVGFVIRQYFHVPISMDFIIAPYNKDRQLVRLEEECHCVVNLLRPNDPRSRYCPPNYRTIEVIYDEDRGRFETFQYRLNRILSPQRSIARLVSTILRQFDGREIAVTAEQAAYLLNSDHRPRYDDIRALVVSGSRLRADRLVMNV